MAIGDFKRFFDLELKTALSVGDTNALVSMIGNIVGQIEKIVNHQGLAGSGNTHVACGPGCPHCCVLNVSVLFPEAVAIGEYLRRTRQLQMLPLLKDFIARTEWMEDSERAWRGIGCVFLDIKGSCSIHSLRPLLCRSVTSTDPEACRAFLGDHGGDVPGIVMDLNRKHIYEEAFLTLADLLDRYGLDSRSLELVRGVAAVLERSEHGIDFLARRRLTFLSS